MAQFQYLWVAKASGNLDIEVLREVTKRVTLELDDPHPLQKREGRQLQDHKEVTSLKNDKIVIKGILQPLLEFKYVCSYFTFSIRIH